MSETLKKLLALLSDGAFHSGEHLGKALGITRSAIWKLIKQLSAWDLEIESITNKGYRIQGGLSLLSSAKILPYLSESSKPFVELEVWDSLPSTNDYLLKIERGKKTKTNIACFAERQTEGRGRRGRGWVSPFAQNIYLSILWHFVEDPCALSGLSLAVGISIIETLRKLGITKPLGIKWPNDIYSDHQKLGGILIELSGEAHDASSMVIGVGLNVAMSSKIKPELLMEPWTDVQSLMGKSAIVDRNALAGSLLHGLIETILQFEAGGFAGFKEKWQTLDLSFGKPVSVLTATQTLQGIGCGINEEGHFLLETEKGELKRFSSGEVSLRLSMPYLPVEIM